MSAIDYNGFWKQLFLVSSIYLAFFLVGITRGYITFLLEQLNEPTSTLKITADQESWIASLNIFSNPLGSVMVGILMDRYGRKKSCVGSFVLFFIGWTLVGSATSITQIYVGDTIIGVAIGMALCSSVYVAEICEQSLRATFLSLFIIYFTSGIAFASVITAYNSWQNSAYIFAAISGVALVLLHTVPESPYWLVKNGKLEAAYDSLDKLRGDHSKCKKETECEDIERSISSQLADSFSLSAAMRHWRPLAVFLLFQICLQGSGYSVLIAYMNNFLNKLPLPFDEEAKKNIIVAYSLVLFASSFLSPFVMTYWSRRKVMMISSIGMTLPMTAIGVYATVERLPSWTNWAVPFCLFAYVFSCTTGAVTLSESMPSEVYPTAVRGFMCGLTEALATTVTGLYVKYFPWLTSAVPVRAVIFAFAFFSFASFLFGMFVLPETRGKTLQEIQRDMGLKTKRKMSVHSINP